METASSSRGKTDTRTHLVEVAARLLHEQGPAAVTTRGVAQAAGVQAPTIYRLFADKGGLLDAVAEHVFATYVSHSAMTLDGADAVANLRVGWDEHISFSLANPTLFRLLIDPERSSSPAAAAGLRVLSKRVHRVAATGRLKVSEPRAVNLIQAAGIGVVLTLLSAPPRSRDTDLADATYACVLQTILTDQPALPTSDASAAAVAFRTFIPELAALTAAERALMAQWLDRVTG